MKEFDIIEHFFRPSFAGRGVKVGPGDDCAVLAVSPHEDLLATTDTLIEGTHFPEQSPPAKLGYRSCATALSDIAAMGGHARWASLSLTMPLFEEKWLKPFVEGFQRALLIDETALIGGDLTQGPLSITWHITGTIPHNTATLRSGAELQDDIYVTGTLGAAAYALEFLQTKKNHPSLDRYWSPSPRLSLSRDLQEITTSCIDISDGLLADLSHILRASNAGAIIDSAAIPAHESLNELDAAKRLAYLLGGGDDYELCFTASRASSRELAALSDQTGVRLTAIGSVAEKDDGSLIRDVNGVMLEASGYQHFQA